MSNPTNIVRFPIRNPVEAEQSDRVELVRRLVHSAVGTYAPILTGTESEHSHESLALASCAYVNASAMVAGNPERGTEAFEMIRAGHYNVRNLVAFLLSPDETEPASGLSAQAS